MKHARLWMLALVLCGCSVAPYNTLIWNRENAECHNGIIDTGPWYEWWYYKVVLPYSGEAFYSSYGVVNPWDTAGEYAASKAYVSMGSFGAHERVTQFYPVSDFEASYEATDVRIRDQRATGASIAGDLVDDAGGEVSWDIQITTRWQYNAMGWAMFVPEITNIFWYPAQADARFTGAINYGGRIYQFENAPGYQDRNWGRTFPEWWAWIVANHFEGYPDTALAAGGGKPVILGITDRVEGLSIGLFHQGREYAFRPNEGDRERFVVNFGIWQVEAINSDGYRIEVEADAPCESFMDLMFPTPQGEEFHDFESLTGEVTVRLYDRAGCIGNSWRLLETLRSDYAGIEYGDRDMALFDCLENDFKVLYQNF